MFKKVLISCITLSLGLSTQAIFAANYSNYHRIKKQDYKGELPPRPQPIVKAVRPMPLPACDSIPCATYAIHPGPYIGLSPGFRTDYNHTASVYKGFEGELYAGYAMLNESFYLGSEIFVEHSAQLQNYRNDLNANLNPIGVRTTWSTGLSVLPGFTVADTLLSYLRLGVIRTHYKDIAETATGGQVGFGLQGTVSESWDLRMEYIYSFYQSLAGLGSPRSDQFHVSFLYKIWS